MKSASCVRLDIIHTCRFVGSSSWCRRLQCHKRIEQEYIQALACKRRIRFGDYLCEPKWPAPEACSSLTGSYAQDTITLAGASHVFTRQLHRYAPDVLELVSHCLYARLSWSAQTHHRICPHHKYRPAFRAMVSRLTSHSAWLAQNVSLVAEVDEMPAYSTGQDGAQCSADHTSSIADIDAQL